MTTNDLCAKQLLGVPTKTISVPSGVPNVKCAKVHQRYQNSLGMTPGVLKCNWCTKRNDCTKRTEDDQEWSYCATIRFCALLHVLLNESTFCPLKFKMAHGRHIENRNRYCRIFFVFRLHSGLRRVAAFVSYLGRRMHNVHNLSTRLSVSSSITTSSPPVAERPRDASCLRVASIVKRNRLWQVTCSSDLPLRINKFCCILFSSSWSCVMQAVINKIHWCVAVCVVKCTVVRRICCSHSTSHRSIVQNRDFFLPRLHLTTPLRGSPSEYRHKIW